MPSRRILLASVGPDQELDLALGPPLDLLPARVRNAAGEPVPGAEVFLLEALLSDGALVDAQGVLALPRRPLAAVADAGGRLRLGCRPGQRVWVRVLARGEPPLSSELVAPAAGQVLELVLPPGATLAGRLVLDDGTPAPHAGLRLELRGHSLWQETRTDAHGRFRLGSLPPGRFELTPSAGLLADGSSLSLLDSLRAGETRTLELRASRASTVSGRAARAGVPLAGWTVELERLGPEWLGSTQSTRTDAAGRFAFGAYAQQFKHRVRLVDPDSGLPVAHATLRAPAGELLLEPDDVLARLATFGGRIRADEAGRAAAFVELYSPILEERRVARVDPSGAFAFPPLPPVQWRVRSWHHGIGPVDHGFVQPETGVSVRFRPERMEPGRLELELEPPPNVAPERVQVALLVPSLYSHGVSSLRWLAPDPTHGRFEAWVPPGEHECLVLVDHVVVEKRGLSVGPRATQRVKLAFPELVPVTLTLVDDEPAYVHDPLVARFGAELAREVPLRQVRYQPHGRFELLLPAGTQRLRVEARSGRAGEWRRDSALGHGEEIALRLDPPR